MSLYQFILDRLSQAGFNYTDAELKKLDIIEYMVLEAAGALHPLQGKPLKCIFRPGHISNVEFNDRKKRSSLEFGLKDVVFNWGSPSISQEELINFNQIVSVIEDKFPDVTRDFEHSAYNRFETLYAIILLDDDIENAIKSSSIFVAAGDLSGSDLVSLLILRKKLQLYKIADADLSILADCLANKITLYLEKNFKQQLIQQASPQAEREFAAMLAIAREEKKFNQLFYELNEKLYELIRKGTPTYKVPFSSEGDIYVNDKYEQSYVSVVPLAQHLGSTLIKARNDFFNNPISQDSFERFQKTCLDAIMNSKDEFAKYRGQAKWYNELHPVLKAIINCIKAIAGIIAGITIVPAVLTAIYSEQGYIGTFFNSKASSSSKLETFEEGLCAEEGIFVQLRGMVA